MPTQVQQANPDGTIVLDLDGPHPSLAEREQVLRDGFAQRDWEIVSLVSNDTRRQTTLTVRKGDHSYKLEVFIFPNLAWDSGGRPITRKRIQLARPYSEHQEEFSLPKDGERRCLLLGLYRRMGKTVVSAWDAYSYREHKNPNSCYLYVSALADAMRTGLGQSLDSKGRLVCCFQPDLLSYYVENMRELHDRIVVNEDLVAKALEGPADDAGWQEVALPSAPNPVPASLPRNRILYGAPGTGKSHRLNDEVETLFPDEALRERVTFHPDYTYAQLVGAYRPVPLYRAIEDELVAADKTSSAGKHEPMIDYRFVPGPFLRMLVKARRHPEHNFVLVIEELNRANAPAVFGEVFQLLDRNDDGGGKFSVTLPAEAQDHLRAEGLGGSLRLPANLYLWATMNSADQGVLPLDAAFKRRWTFEYVPLDSAEAAAGTWTLDLKPFGTIPWNDFRHAINAHLSARGIAEDRLLGPFFMSKDELANPDAVKNKLLLYLRDDVVRHDPDLLFRVPWSYGALIQAYEKGEAIFAEGIGLGGTP